MIQGNDNTKILLKEKLLVQLKSNIHMATKKHQETYLHLLNIIDYKVLTKDKSKRTKYKHLDEDERKFIDLCLRCKISQRLIANYLDRSPNTINLEVKRNKTIQNYTSNTYNATTAHKISLERLTNVLNNGRVYFEGFKEFIRENKHNKWSLEQLRMQFIAKYPNAKVPALSTLYNWRATKLLPDLEYYRYKKQRRPICKTYYCGDKRSISDRPIEEDDYTTPGHYEIDTIFNDDLQGGLLTLNHRASMKLYSIIIPNRKARTINRALSILIKQHNLQIKTITSDNGSEFTNWKLVEEEFGLKWYFAHPYRSCERGQNERLNRDIRIYYPKGTNFRNIASNDFDKTISDINNLCRKKFNFLSANEKEHLLMIQ